MTDTPPRPRWTRADTKALGAVLLVVVGGWTLVWLYVPHARQYPPLIALVAILLGGLTRRAVDPRRRRKG